MNDRHKRLLGAVADDMARMQEIHEAQERRTADLMKYLVTATTICPQKVTWRAGSKA